MVSSTDPRYHRNCIKHKTRGIEARIVAVEESANPPARASVDTLSDRNDKRSTNSGGIPLSKTRLDVQRTE